MARGERVFRATMLVTAVIVLSKVAGFVRDVILANYFGTGDPLWWRLGFLGLTLLMWYFDIFGLLPVILYTAFWIIVPEAHTAEDRLRMEGRDVNPQNLNEQILRDSANASSQQYNVQPSSGNTPLKVLFGVLLAVLLLPFGGLLLFLLLHHLTTEIIKNSHHDKKYDRYNEQDAAYRTPVHLHHCHI